MGDLKPCPFCGAEVKIYENPELGDMAYIACLCCGAVVSFRSDTHKELTKEEVVWQWNFRQDARYGQN